MLRPPFTLETPSFMHVNFYLCGWYNTYASITQQIQYFDAFVYLCVTFTNCLNLQGQNTFNTTCSFTCSTPENVQFLPIILKYPSFFCSRSISQSSSFASENVTSLVFFDNPVILLRNHWCRVGHTCQPFWILVMEFTLLLVLVHSYGEWPMCTI